VDFFELFRKIEREFETCFILESLGEQGSYSRYSIIGFDPKHIISAKETNLYFDGKKYEVENPYFALREIIPSDTISKKYAGGAVGYLSYEAVNFFEKNLNVKIHPDFDQFMFGVYLDGLILDKITGELFYFFYDQNRSELIKNLVLSRHSGDESSRTPESSKGYDSGQARMTVRTSQNDTIDPGQARMTNTEVEFLGDTLSKEEHAEAVKKVIEEIKKGNTFQCEVGFKSKFKITGNTLLIYEKLRQVNPSPFMYYLKFGSRKIIGASPELLLSLRDGDMETFPLAGTIKRGKNAEEDQILARKLLNNPKEIAEHNMLVDLHRNDLGRVSKFGTVKVRSLMDIKKYSHVQHISSEITGVIKDDEDMFSAVAANFPMGTATGAPKVESMKIIDRNEKEARGPYGGGVGHFGFNGDCTFALTLRSLFISGEDAYAQTSGGIVYDSEVDKEYQEIVNKLAAMKEVLLDESSS